MSVRSAIVLVILALTFCVQPNLLRADADDPVGYTALMHWNGQVLSSTSNRYLHRTKPAWTSTAASIERLAPTGRRDRGVLGGLDIRAAAVWRNRVIAIRVQPDGVDVLILNAALDLVSQREVVRDRFVGPDDQIVLACSDSVDHAYILVGTDLYQIDPIGLSSGVALVERRVLGVLVQPLAQGEVAMVHDVGGTAFLTIRDAGLTTRAATTVPLAPASRLVALEKTIAVISELDDALETQITFVDPETNETRTLTIPAPPPLVALAMSPSGPVVATVILRQGRFELITGEPHTMVRATNEVAPPGTILGRDLGLPIGVRIVDEQIYVISRAGLVTADLQGDVQSRDPLILSLDPRSLRVVVEGRETYLVSATGSVWLQGGANPFWWLLRALNTVWTFVVPIALFAVIAVLWLRNRRLRRFLDTMLEVPGAGLVFVLDANGRLSRTNERAARLLRISSRVPMGRIFQSYLRHAGVEGIRTFLAEAYTDQRPLSEKVSVNDDDEQREYVFTSLPMFGTLGLLRGIVITGVDITEALERRRLVNWAQLAHDMQTNLSTIRLNAEQLSREASNASNERVRRILFQTRVLTQRVRDLVGVGRSEELSRAPVHSAEFCTQLRHEFDPEMFPHVTFSMKLRGTMMNVDRLKLSRAVRNAVENAIKSLRGSPGIVEIATWSDREHVYLRISDNGVGMDTLTLENMMKPYFTTAKDGSGTGIGTMIMQHVTHLHGGSLRVTSEPGEGTQVVFRIPLHMQGARHTPDESMETVAV